jgi:hypothetical protein
MPSRQAHVGPLEEMIHWALGPQEVPAHCETHSPTAFSVKPLWHRHQAAWSSGWQLALEPQGSEVQGLEHWLLMQASCPGQCESVWHSEDLVDSPMHPEV